MGLDARWLFASLVVSSIGYVLVTYGRKIARPPHLIIGLVLLVFPYFVTALGPMLIVAGVLLAVLWLAVWLGW